MNTTKPLTRFLSMPKLEDIDFVILDTGNIVREFKDKISRHEEAVPIFEHVLCQAFEYITNEEDSVEMINEFCTECCDIVYPSGAAEDEFTALHTAIDEFCTQLVALIKSMGLFIDGAFIYSFKDIVGDDIVVGYQPSLTIEPSKLQLRVP